jgi:hypothetical protein
MDGTRGTARDLAKIKELAAEARATGYIPAVSVHPI